MRTTSFSCLAILLWFSLINISVAQVSLLWETPSSLGDKGALYAPATRNYPLNYVLDTVANTARFYSADTYALLYTFNGNGKYEYPYYVLPDMNGNGHQEIVFANYNLPTYSVRIRDLSTGANIQSWTDATISHALWYVLTSPGSNILKLAMLKTNINTGASSLAVYSLGVSATAVDEAGAPTPEEMKLHQNFPNPFNPETRIRFDIPASSDVQIEVFDMTGRLVRTFALSRKDAGAHEVVWNGKDNSGASSASGTYLYRLIVNGAASAKKMLLLR